MMEVKDRPDSHKKMRLKLLGLIVLFVLLAIFDFPATYNKTSQWLKGSVGFGIGELNFEKDTFRLGLDLVGGAHLVYEVNTTPLAPDQDVDEAVRGVRDVIERRVNAFGVGEPLVQTNKQGDINRVIVELPGVTDIQAAVDSIGETPLLEFKEPGVSEQPPLTEEEQAQLNSKNEEAFAKAQEALAALRSKSFEEVAAEFSEDEVSAKQNGEFSIREGEANAQVIEWATAHQTGFVSRVVEDFENGYYLLKDRGEEEVAITATASHILVCFEGSAVEQCPSGLNKEEAFAKISEIATQATTQNFAALATIHSNDESAAAGGELGELSRGQTVPEFEAALFALSVDEISSAVETPFGYHLIHKRDETRGTQYNLSAVFIEKTTETDLRPPVSEWKNTELTGAYLERATVQFDPNSGIPQVGLRFNKQGKELFAEITKRNLNQPVAIFLDGVAISVPTVQQEITNGEAVISGNFSITEAKDLAKDLNAGALPLPIELVSEQRVGASLGAESLARSLNAALIGFILVSIFIIAYYRLAGLLAFFALVIYSIIVLAIFKFIPVTLTVSGVAGFILSLGIAVDANIIIFERIKEERWKGKRLHQAVELGFRRAWTSIRDANVSTLITSGILFWFGTSVIKGFALTLSIGVIISMISAIFITRFLLRFFLPRLDEHTRAILGTPKVDSDL